MAKYKIMYAVVGITITKIADRITTGPSFVRSVHDTSEEAYAARVEMDDSVQSFITPEIIDENHKLSNFEAGFICRK